MTPEIAMWITLTTPALVIGGFVWMAFLNEKIKNIILDNYEANVQADIAILKGQGGIMDRQEVGFNALSVQARGDST